MGPIACSACMYEFRERCTAHMCKQENNSVTQAGSISSIVAHYPALGIELKPVPFNQLKDCLLRQNWTLPALANQHASCGLLSRHQVYQRTSMPKWSENGVPAAVFLLTRAAVCGWPSLKM